MILLSNSTFDNVTACVGVLGHASEEIFHGFKVVLSEMDWVWLVQWAPGVVVALLLFLYMAKRAYASGHRFGAKLTGAASNLSEPAKMVLVVNTSLSMGKGKIAAQCCHAAVALAQWYSKHRPKMLEHWQSSGARKIVVKADSAEALEEIATKARNAGVPYYLVRDAGYTQIEAGSKTVLGLGPVGDSHFAELTNDLKLM